MVDEDDVVLIRGGVSSSSRCPSNPFVIVDPSSKPPFKVIIIIADLPGSRPRSAPSPPSSVEEAGMGGSRRAEATEIGVGSWRGTRISAISGYPGSTTTGFDADTRRRSDWLDVRRFSDARRSTAISCPPNRPFERVKERVDRLMSRCRAGHSRLLTGCCFEYN